MEEDDSDIAAAMGFSSFGGTKKRKYDQSNSPKPKADASGANSTQLGVRTRKSATDQPDGVDVAGDATPIASPAAPSLPQAKSAQKPPAATGLADFLARAQTLPSKPPDTQQNSSMPDRTEPSAPEMVSFGGPSISKDELYALRFGVKNENGDTAYFLPNFIGDPWEGMKSGK
jgi:hypothetical protein